MNENVAVKKALEDENFRHSSTFVEQKFLLVYVQIDVFSNIAYVFMCFEEYSCGIHDFFGCLKRFQSVNEL
jgi:hypothetical protein